MNINCVKHFLFLISLLFVSCGSQPLKNEAKIEVETLNYDLGKLAKNDRVRSFDIEFKNTGNIILVLSRVPTSCTCTSAKFPLKPIEPGDKGTINVTVDLTEFSRLGAVEEKLAIYSNGSKEPIEITIVGEIVE